MGQFLADLVNPIRVIIKKAFEKKPKPSSFLKTLAILASVAIATYFLIYPLIGTAIGLTIVNSSAKTLSNSFTNLEDNSSQVAIQRIEKNIDRISDNIGTLYWIFYITGQKDFYNNISQLILGTQYTIDGAQELLNATYPLAQYIKNFEPAVTFQSATATSTREYREYLELMEDNKYKLDEASYKISLASEIINQLNTNSFPKFLQDKVLEIKELITKVQGGTQTFKEAIRFLPDVLGVDGRKRYLILFQNESELRSTGGWLTSYGIIGIEGGQIRELFVDDIYNADGTLRVQGKRYSPPESMQNALSVKDWLFSLVNWSPDLSETREASQQFVSALGKGNDVDGIITVDITFFQKLLNKWGGIEVPGEDELITGENLHEKVFQMHREFTPGSTQKTTFLADLANEIIKKLLSMDIGQIADMSDILQSSLDEKHLQIAFKNNEAFNFFNNRNWAGSLDSKYNDAPIVIDWNWGGNKANQYLNKNLALSINIKDENTIDLTYTATVENTSNENVYPQGDYINYQRIYIPAEAQILKISGMEDNKYAVYRESGYKVLGGWFNVPSKEIKSLEVSYRLERDSIGMNFPLEQKENTIFLDLNIFKQAGERKHAYKLDLSYPPTWVLSNSAGLNTISNQLSGRFELNRDTEYRIIWNTPN